MSTKIEWCDDVLNIVTGCSPISSGCTNCYARRMANRLKGRFGYPADDPFKVTFHPDRLDQPLKWKKPKRIFIDSMGDLFHPDVKKGWLFHIFDMIDRCPQHTFILLTKRPENIIPMLYQGYPAYFGKSDYMKNVWLGVSVENQRHDDRILALKEIPAAVRFVSLEPLIGPFDFLPPWLRFLDWCVLGGETGPGARPMKISWVSDINRQCRDAGVPIFIKQLHINGKISKDMNEWPEYLRRREFPK